MCAVQGMHRHKLKILLNTKRLFIIYADRAVK